MRSTGAALVAALLGWCGSTSAFGQSSLPLDRPLGFRGDPLGEPLDPSRPGTVPFEAMSRGAVPDGTVPAESLAMPARPFIARPNRPPTTPAFDAPFARGVAIGPPAATVAARPVFDRSESRVASESSPRPPQPGSIGDPDAWFGARDRSIPSPFLADAPSLRSIASSSRPGTPAADRIDYAAPTDDPARRHFAPGVQPGDHFFDPTPRTSPGIALIEPAPWDFSPDPIYEPLPYDGDAQVQVYAGKRLYATQRPLIEWGRELYGPGQYPRSLTFLGSTNLITPQLLVYGDFRSGIASNRVAGNTKSIWANRLNLEIDLEITATERFHAFAGPLDRNGQFTRVEYDERNATWHPEFDPDFDLAFFEGDAGSIWGGLNGDVMPFTLPFAAGVFPMFVQNGYWINDAFLGGAFTIPARHSPLLDIANVDVTFFTVFDEVDSPVFGPDDDPAKVYGVTSWIEAWNGYTEVGYAFVDDREALDRSYHSIALAYSRRYGAFLSNSVRMIANAGQTPRGVPQSADGVLLVFENSLITRQPATVVPYFNLFAGFDRPQSVARAPAAGGILNHAGINFETDGLTGFPTLDASANDVWGGALGMNLLPQDFSQQLVAEFAFLQTFGSAVDQIPPGDQYGVALRYQIPISNAVILRADAMHGFLENSDDVSGIRFELRHKF